MINVQIKIHTKDKVNTKEKNYRRISKNISQKSKEKLTKDFIKIPKEKTYNEKTAGTFTSCFASISVISKYFYEVKNWNSSINL